MRPLWPPPTITASQWRAASSATGAGRPTSPSCCAMAFMCDLLCDGVDDDGAALWTRTGLHSISSRSLERARAARRAAAAAARSRPGEQRRASQAAASRLGSARASAGSGTTATSSSTSAWTPPSPTTSTGTTASRRTDDEQLGAGRRHPLDEHVRVAVRDRAPRVARRRALVGEVQRQRAVRGLVQQPGLRALQRDRAAELASAATASSSSGGEPAAPPARRRARSSAFASCSASQRAAVSRRAARPRASRRRSRAAGAGSGGRRGERGGARDAGAEAGDRRHARLGEAASGLVVEQLGQRGGDEHADVADRGAGEDASSSRAPGLALVAVEPGRLVEEDERLADAGVAPTVRTRSRCTLDVAPDQRRVVERVGRRSRRPAAARAAPPTCPRRERRQRHAAPGRLVGGRAPSPRPST